MSFQDWYSNFSTLFIGIKLTQDWKGVLIRDSWSQNKTGFAESMNSKDNIKKICSKNHQFHIELKEDTDILFELQQKDIRLLRGSTYPYN